MNLSDITGHFPNIRLATENDNQDILQFLKTVSMDSGKLALRYQRDPDFFALLKEQGNSYFVFLFIEQDNKTIGGMSVISIRDCYFKGEKSRVAYLSDLRVSPTLWKRTRFQWRKCYAMVLEKYKECQEFEGLSAFYSAILDENQDAIRSFTQNKSDIIYRPLLKYQSCNIAGRIPSLIKLGRGKYQIDRAGKEDKAELLAFLKKQNKDRLFGYPFGIEEEGEDLEFSFREKQWPGFSLSSFFIVRNKSREIISCVAPWSSGKARRLWVEKIGRDQAFLGKVTALLDGKEIKLNSELRVLYLTCLEFDNGLTDKEQGKILLSLLDRIYKEKLHKDHHIVQFMIWENQDIDRGLLTSGFLFQRTPATLYQVMHKNFFEAGESIEVKDSDVGFELGMS